MSTHQIAIWSVRVASLFVLALLGAACASPAPALGRLVGDINTTYEWSDAVIAPGDELSIRFAEHTGYNHEVVVREDGTASFVGVGPLPVAGLAPSELETKLVERYTPTFATAPRIDVQRSARAERHVVVMGEVMTPGRVVFDGRMTFHEAIGLAGGPRKDTALLEQTLLVRWVASQGRQRAWKFDARDDQWGLEQPLYLQPDDVVFIPNTPIDDVDIWVEQYIRRLLPFPLLIPIGSP